MMCVKTIYHDERVANQAIRKSERSAIKRPKKTKMVRKAYRCSECGFVHILKYKA